MFTAAKILLSCLYAHVLYYSVLSATRPLVNQRQTFARSFSPPPPLLLFFRAHFSLSLSLSLHPNQKRSWPNEQVAKRTSTPGCGELTRVLRKATYVRFPFLLFLSCGSLFFFITCRSDIGSRISVFLGNRSRELT